MLELKELYARKKEASGQVSTQIRALALGMVAIAWALLTAHDEPLKAMARHVPRIWLLGLSALGVLALASDMLQYIAQTSMANEAANRAENSVPKVAEYEDSLFAYKAQKVFYFGKLWILAVCFVDLIVIFCMLFFS